MLEMIPYFSGLNRSQMDNILYGLSVQSYDAGEYIFLPGNMTDDVFFIVSGKI